MTIGHDDLTRPLGLEPARPQRRWAALPLGQIFVAAVAVVFLALSAYLAVVKDPFGGEPYAIASIERGRKVEPAPQPEARAPVAAEAPASPVSDRSSAAEIERDSGVKVVRGGGAEAQGVVIRVPPPVVRLTPAPDKRVAELSRHGTLPRIGTDGARPADIYARPPPAATPRMPRIAIVVTGLGLSQAVTADAITRLPPDVTLAFAPYGTELERQAVRARENGHEIMLQVPMEPFDYPDNDPGPHTLTTGAAAVESIDRLHWLMSRFPGYVGVVNQMGAKFTSDEAALTTVLKEVGARGLVALDDGSSPRSLVTAVAGGLKLPAARADGTLDAAARGSAIDDQLARLETLARERGLAIGVSSAVPVSIDRIAAWARGLQAKGILLVPVSAAIARPGRV